MNDTPDYYATLGVAPTAAADDLKHAYRLAAKRAHPDAGGNAAAMERVNEAYRVLSDPASRAEYNQLRDQLNHPPAPDAPPAAQAAYETKETQLRTELHRRQRRAQARTSAWRLLRSSAGLSLLLGFITRFFAGQTTVLSQKLTLSFIGFIPLYGVMLALAFLLNPEFRLAPHDLADDLAHRRRLQRDDLIVVAALVLAFIILAVCWLLLVH
jgi:curved DNA-binding protein CbpA